MLSIRALLIFVVLIIAFLVILAHVAVDAWIGVAILALALIIGEFVPSGRV